jgi:hypothetical protein
MFTQLTRLFNEGGSVGLQNAIIKRLESATPLRKHMNLQVKSWGLRVSEESTSYPYPRVLFSSLFFLN